MTASRTTGGERAPRHYREAWPVPKGRPLDAVNYAILRRDWATGTTTPVRFDDFT
ncbi:hypothetical protein [Brachybacterium tyrofermentans]|uniref:hypothetical protein n=1 Tax=Brachybacterium tyrofermentans TaxID=47848 RepID=UPI003F91FB68